MVPLRQGEHYAEKSVDRNIYKRVQGMALYVKENLSAEESALFLDMVDPQPESGPAKKPRKKRGPRSARASGMATAIKNSIEQGKQAAAATAENTGKLSVACKRYHLTAQAW